MRRGVVSPFGRKTDEPKSTITPTRFFPATAFVFPQMLEKDGATFGAFASGIASLLKVNAQPSTDPSSTFTVGPVIAAVHLVAPGAA